MRKVLVFVGSIAVCAAIAAAASAATRRSLAFTESTPGLVGSGRAEASIASLSGTYRGETGQRGKVMIEVSNGDVLGSSSFFDYSAPCNGGTALTGSTAISGQLHPGNTFSVVNAHYSSQVQGGFTAHHTTTIRFNLGLPDAGDTPSTFGTFYNSATITNSSGTVVARCSTNYLFFDAYAQGAHSLRVCMPPGASGAYLSATANVTCGTANYVSKHMASAACIKQGQCTAKQFTCRSGFPGHLEGTFEETHHGLCSASRTRRIEFDWS